MPTLETLGFAFIGGLLPALVWLYFLLREDDRCPEPRPLITLAFAAGMLSVLFALPLESLAVKLLSTSGEITRPVIVAWAIIEETLKYALAAIFVLWRRDVNESLDLVVYMLTVALGFAALENILFLIPPIANGHFITGIETNNLRFIGATLLHVIASSCIGFALAFSFRWSKIARSVAAIVGVVLAIALHAVFNFFIMSDGELAKLYAFFMVWIGVVLFFALFEILRYLRYRNLPRNTC